MTVEFAVVLPAVVLVLVVLLGAVVVVDGRGRLELAAATTARALGRGDATAAEAFAAIAPGATRRTWHADGLVCVEAERHAAGPFAGLRVRATSCAAEGGR
ncbi:TadE family type IV pilus minor pilin [Curtobacterium sp. ISL-83]|uniref:TadE family type IV pilus minor pilin n=1 Tax=Curtobacterium sp. ISL-83 TaxID=2819145 RepID=UPI001BEA4079|nr:TadE family type IV pilus minor pilin [Curtobacterium sp. ISL-83]MBT2502957.1 TadE family protein [Curtobacterium sp. ISL-83]